MVPCGLWAADDIQLFIIGGQEVAGDSPIAKQTVLIKGKIQRATFTCSGSILSENVILTAGHCLGGGGYADLEVFFGPNGSAGSIKVINQIRRRDIPPDSEMDWDDVAVLKLERNIPAGFTPVQFYPDSNWIEKGSAVILAGYGQTVVEAPDSGNGGSGRLRSVDQVILEPKFGQSEILINIKTKGACRGDSGGPAFIERDGQLFQIGAASRLTENNRLPNRGREKRYGCLVDMVYSDVLAQKAWIESTMTSL